MVEGALLNGPDHSRKHLALEWPLPAATVTATANEGDVVANFRSSRRRAQGLKNGETISVPILVREIEGGVRCSLS